MVARGLSACAEGWTSIPSSASAHREQVAPIREQARRLGIVRRATDAVRPKSGAVRRLRIGQARPHEALRDAMHAALDATPVYALGFAGREWCALLDDLRAEVCRRTRAGDAERDYARQDDE
jgi:hypothetical protein